MTLIPWEPTAFRSLLLVTALESFFSLVHSSQVVPARPTFICHFYLLIKLAMLFSLFLLLCLVLFLYLLIPLNLPSPVIVV